MTTTEPKLSFDEQLDALCDYRRRQLLFTLLDRPPEASVDPLSVDRLVDRQELLVAMRHVQLPKLEAVGVVDVNADDTTVRRGATFNQLIPLLQLLADNRDELRGHIA